MPYTNVPAVKVGKMDSCVEQMQAQGYDRETAIAICYHSVVEGRTTEYLEALIQPRREGPDFAGREWEVTIIGARTPADVVTIEGKKYVKSKNGRFYSCAGLRESVPRWDGVQVYDNHLTDAEFEERAGMRSVVKEWLGSIVEPRWDAKKRQLRGVLKVVEEAIARKLKNAFDQGILDTIGLSIDTKPRGREAFIEGKRQPLIEGFEKIFSVDLVAEPAAGGRFERLVAATQIGGTKMSMTLEQLEKRVVQLEAALSSREQVAGEPETPPTPETPEEVVEEVEEKIEEVAEAAPPDADPAEVAQVIADVAQDVADVIAEKEEEPETAMEAVRRLECRIALRDQLDAAKLPPNAYKLVKDAFEGKSFDLKESKRMIESLKSMIAARDGSGRVQGAGGNGGRIQVGMNERDWREVEFMRLIMGNTGFRALEHIEIEYVQERVPESYKAWTKSKRVHGNTRRISEWVYEAFGNPFAHNTRFYEAATTSTMSSIVKNALNVMLAADFGARHQWWQPIVREEEVDTIDQATLVRTYGLNTLSVVDEGQAYTELTWADEEETADFVKKGNYVGITLETLLRDKVNKVRAIPELLADSWYNTLSAMVASVFTTNTHAGPQLGDTGALFNSTALTSTGGHLNLLTAPLTFTAYGAARSAMMKQTSMWSQGESAVQGVRLLIIPKYILVPVDLFAMANMIYKSEFLPGSANNDINPYQNEAEPIVVPEWDDADNWAAVGDKERHPAIWLVYHRGNRVPELFTSDSETQGAMFTNDTLRYKVRMLTYYFSSVYTCAPVSDWRALHKNNVS